MKDGNAFNVTPRLKDIPLVSMMDFNLILGETLFGGISSPFMKRLNGSSGRFYDTVGEDVVRRQVFMAGGWNSDSNLTYQAYNSANIGRRINLKYPEYQPFAGYGWFPANTTLPHCYNDVSENHPFWQPLNKDFPILSTALLCDYLDYDNVPLSLCIPCTEAVPMICGVELNDDCVKYKVSVVQNELQAANAEQGLRRKIERIYSMQVAVNGLSPTITTVYPFINGPQGQSGDSANYTVEAVARIFFTTESGLDDGSLNDMGLRASNSGLGTLELGQWGASDITSPVYIQVPCGNRQLQARAPSGTGESAEKDSIRDDTDLRSANITKNGNLAKLVYEVDENGNETLVESECAGYVDSFIFFENWIAWDGARVLDCFKNGSNSALKFRPSVAVWVRIKNVEDKTVDMVPATPSHDVYNGYAVNRSLHGFNKAMGGDAGDPILRFFPKKGNADDPGVILSKAYFESPDNRDRERPVKWKQKAYIANDPRINWAPEQWWATNEETSPKQLWFENVRTFRQNNIWCDTDIFMSVSDQGYMQSVYEWLLIPQVLRIRKDAEDYDRNNANMEWGFFEGGEGYDGEVNTSVGDVLHKEVMWRTHRSTAFMKEGVDPETWEWGLVDRLPFDDSDTGIRVNPYTDSMNVMLGAFANMPRDWWAASTNQYALGKTYMAPGSSLNQNYLFDWSCNYQDVYNMAYYWMGAFKRWDMSNKEERSKLFYQPDYWKEVFEDAIYWYDGRVAYDVPIMTSENLSLDSGILNDSTVEPILKNLTMAERKFLYGYLKGCFANNHQLFLIFVRAESAAGGGGAGSGARAVALVWRDPNAPMKNGQFVKADGGTEEPNYGKDNAQKYLKLEDGMNEESWRLNERVYPPHKTRILFYHQLD
jgi:hypothetical protein